MKRHILLVVLFAFVVSAAAAQDPFEVFVYVDRDTLTLHVPSSGVISLDGIGFQVQVNDAARTVELADYPAFGLPFDQLPTPICFRLRSSGSRTPLPQACSGAITLTQDLAAADVFWYDAGAESSRVILVTQNGVPFTICPSGASECTGTLTPPEATSTPAPTETLMPTETPIAAAAPEQAFEPVMYTSPDGLFTFEYPDGWVSESYMTYPGGGTIIIGATEVALSIFGEHVPEHGEQAVLIGVGTIEAITNDSLLSGTLENLVTHIAASLLPVDETPPEPTWFEINGEPAARLIFSDDSADRGVVFMEAGAGGYFAYVSGAAAEGELDALIPIMDQIAESIEVNPPAVTSESLVATVNLDPGVSLHMRASPNITSLSVALLSNGTAVPILAVSADGEWYRVSYEGSEGWIMAQYTSVTGDISTLPIMYQIVLSTQENENTPDATSELPMATVILQPGANLHMRASPNITSLSVALLSNGTAVPILAVSADGEWYRVSYEGSEGWIMAEYVSVTGDVSTLPRE